MGRLVMLMGAILLVMGALIVVFERFHLPGDFVWRRGGFTLYAPLATSILLSLVLTLLLNLLARR
jgi:hypothetical protein